MHTGDKAVSNCKKELNELSTREEILWKQRSKVTCLKEGDRNTKYFHNVASTRRRNNQIWRIKDKNGVWRENKELDEVFKGYYTDVFTTAEPRNMDNVFEAVDKRIPDHLMIHLEREFSSVEIKQALDQIGPNKTPGPDGMTTHFFQSY
ncbi:hypothetical protein DITRI_Ditri02bG0068900 [Diplodiscus trichospermus]